MRLYEEIYVTLRVSFSFFLTVEAPGDGNVVFNSDAVVPKCIPLASAKLINPEVTFIAIGALGADVAPDELKPSISAGRFME